MHEAGGGGEGHVGSYSCDDDGFDLGGVDATFGQADPGGFGGQVAGGYSFVDEMTLTDARTFLNPLIIGGHHFFEVCVGQQAGWDVGAYGGDFGADGVPGLQGETQTTTSSW